MTEDIRDKYKSEICEGCNGHGDIWGNRSRGDEECTACEGEGMTYIQNEKREDNQMNKYTIYVHESKYSVHEVEANSVQEAENKAIGGEGFIFDKTISFEVDAEKEDD